MNLAERISACHRLGEKMISDLPTRQDLLDKVKAQNAWFDQDQVVSAAEQIAINYLQHDLLQAWINPYDLQENIPRKIGIIMAGNLPFVGFHDVLAIFISGHYSKIKLSHKDTLLWPYLIEMFREIDERTQPYFEIVEKMNEIDALIATGSDNASRYFHYYFAKYPHIIRKNRVGVAVLTGRESDLELEMLGKDIFQYFGLGCRNVSSLMVPADYDITRLCKAWDHYAYLRDNHAYANNYDYNMAIYMMNKIPFLVNDAILFVESDEIVSRLAVIHYTYYNDMSEVIDRLDQNHEKIQVVVSHDQIGSLSVLPPGQAQCPGLSDYADHVDTIKFLQNI